MNDKDQLYQSMAEHDDIEPIMSKVAKAVPVDEWSGALCLFRDCFSADGVHRKEARRALLRMLHAREHLQQAYENAMLRAGDAETFQEALGKVGAGDAQKLRMDYARQMNQLMGRNP